MPPGVSPDLAGPVAGCGLCVLAAGLAGAARRAGRPAVQHARPAGFLLPALPLTGGGHAAPARPVRPWRLPRTARPPARHDRSPN